MSEPIASVTHESITTTSQLYVAYHVPSAEACRKIRDTTLRACEMEHASPVSYDSSLEECSWTVEVPQAQESSDKQ